MNVVIHILLEFISSHCLVAWLRSIHFHCHQIENLQHLLGMNPKLRLNSDVVEVCHLTGLTLVGYILLPHLERHAMGSSARSDKLLHLPVKHLK